MEAINVHRFCGRKNTHDWCTKACEAGGWMILAPAVVWAYQASPTQCMSLSCTCIRVITLKSSRADIVLWLLMKAAVGYTAALTTSWVGGWTWYERELSRFRSTTHVRQAAVTKCQTRYWMQFILAPRPNA